jgi:ankyrin repeat protein
MDDDRKTSAPPIKEKEKGKALQKESPGLDEVTTALVEKLRMRWPLSKIRSVVEGGIFFRHSHAPNLVLARKASGSGTTPLHEALTSGCPLCTIKYLVKTCPESVRIRSDLGILPLHVAVDPEEGLVNPKAVRPLVTAWPASLMERSVQGWLPLHLALTNGEGIRRAPQEFDTIKRMVRLAPQALRAPGPDGKLPIHCLVGRGSRADVKTVQLVVDAHPEALLARDGNGKTLLHLAAGYRPIRPDEDTLSVVRCLAEACPDALGMADNEGLLPLHEALYWDDGEAEEMSAAELDEVTAVVQFLVEARPQALQVADREGNLPLHVAARWGVPRDVMRLLVSRNKEELTAKNAEGWLPVHLALRFDRSDEEVRRAARRADVEMVLAADFFVKPWPASLKERGADGRTLVHRALAMIPRAMWQFVVLSHLTEFPQAVLVRDVDGSLPLHRAAAAGEDDFPLTLLYKILQAQPGVLRQSAGVCEEPSLPRSMSTSSSTQRSGPPAPKRARVDGAKD